MSEREKIENGLTTISCRPETKDRLARHGVKGESFDSLINRILDKRERVKRAGGLIQ